MTMAEIELDILNDLRELGDSMSCYSYLIGYAQEAREFPARLRTEEYRIKDCQGLTWADAHWAKDTFSFRGDSDSLIVKGGLAILEELYDGRTRREIGEYQCGLLRNETFTQYFTPEQVKGLRAVLAVISARSSGDGLC